MKIGFIGAGNMGGAMIRGAVKAKTAQSQDIWVYDKNTAAAKKLADELNITLAEDSTELVTFCDCIILAVKPNFIEEVIDIIKPWLQGKCLISIAAGWTFDMLKEACAPFEDQAAILRVMPNTAVAINQGTTILSQKHSLTQGMLLWATGFFSSLGYVCMLQEELLNPATAISGSGPAYAYLLMESMVDGAVRLGLPRDVATRLAAQTFIGAGKMAMSSGQEPSSLKNAVSSPKGSTIEALYVLEQNAFKGSVMEAMEMCDWKLRAMEEDLVQTWAQRAARGPKKAGKDMSLTEDEQGTTADTE